MILVRHKKKSENGRVCTVRRKQLALTTARPARLGCCTTETGSRSFRNIISIKTETPPMTDVHVMTMMEEGTTAGTSVGKVAAGCSRR